MTKSTVPPDALSLMTDELAQQVGKALQRARGDRTQEWLSGASGVSRIVISKIENGKQKRIELATYAALSKALGTETDWFKVLADTKISEGQNIGPLVVEDRTREPTAFAEAASHLVGAALSLPKETLLLFTTDRCLLDDTGVQKLATATGKALEEAYGLSGGEAVSSLAIAIHQRLLVWIDTNDESDGTTLHALETFCGELCTWIGWIAVDAGNHSLAQSYLQEAVFHSRVAYNSITEVCALNNLSVLYVRTGSPNRAKRVIESALQLRSRIPSRLESLLQLRGAVASGYLKDKEGFDRYALAARRAFDIGPGSNEPLWFRSFSSAEVTGLLGWGMLHLGQSAAAAVAFEETISGMDSPRARAHYNIQLGRALAAQGAYSDAARCGSLALPELKKLRSQPIRDDFRRLMASLKNQRSSAIYAFLEACRFESAE